MKPPTMLAQLCAVAVLAAPLALPGQTSEDTNSALKLVKYVEPEFPARLRLEGVPEGTVTLVISREASGMPADILVVESTHPYLSAAAIEAVQQWRFTPARDEAETPAVLVRIGFRFSGIIYVQPFWKDFAVRGVYGSDKAPVKVPQLQSMAQAPKALSQPMPAYPSSLAGQAVEGSATVKFYVDEEGHVRIPQVIAATNPEFAAAAVAAVSQWRYEPPRIGTRRVVASDHWTFKFAANN